jgi:hypothetical protein
MIRRVLLILFILSLPICQAQEIDILLLTSLESVTSLGLMFKADPLIDYVGVPCRAEGLVAKGADPTEMMRFIRIYFPRRYQEMKEFELIILNGAEYQLFTPEQDKMMYDAVMEGTGGINGPSVLSCDHVISLAWAYSKLSDAFPNDADLVAEKLDGGRRTGAARVEVNRDFPDPVLTPFIPYGLEDIVFNAGRFVEEKQGAEVMAWQVGGTPGPRVKYLCAWDYEKGRTITSGDFVSYNDIFSVNPRPVGGVILMNMILYTAQRDLIEDVALYRNLRSKFLDFRNKMALLISLKDFVDSFGANTDEIELEARRLEGIYDEGVEHYRDQEFQKAEDTMSLALDEFAYLEELAREVKDRALLWVYVIEWLVTSSALFISGFVLWTLMVRRKLYREVEGTRFDRA